MIKVSYTVMCKNDVSKELSLADIFANEKVEKAIKSEFAKGLRNLVLSHKEEAEVILKTEKDVFEMIVSKNDFERSELIEGESIRYAFAYSYYMIGDHEACETELKHLTRPDLFNKATELRKNMQKCKDNHWECEL